VGVSVSIHLLVNATQGVQIPPVPAAPGWHGTHVSWSADGSKPSSHTTQREGPTNCRSISPCVAFPTCRSRRTPWQNCPAL
jgi:hypothetical protein